MAAERISKGIELRSLVKGDGSVEVSVVEAPVPTPKSDEVLVRVEAAPINPSDIDQMLVRGNTGAITRKAGDVPAISLPLPRLALQALQARIDLSLPMGNEGAGIVIAAGSSPEAQKLLGRTVSVSGGGMYRQYRIAKPGECIVFPHGTDPRLCAASFVNPLTALGMVETMRRENHTALVHTAAASNLGRMLNRICLKDGIALVNVVRGARQAELLRSEGATHVCDMNAPGFFDDLTKAIAETGASIGFDATGGGELADRLLKAMENAMLARLPGYQRYGSSGHKQVYSYGRLNTDPLVLNRNYGGAWSIGGWLLMLFLAKLEAKDVDRLKARVVAEIDTTFASAYASEVSLMEAIEPANVVEYTKRSTGNKFLIRPHG